MRCSNEIAIYECTPWLSSGRSERLMRVTMPSQARRSACGCARSKQWIAPPASHRLYREDEDLKGARDHLLTLFGFTDGLGSGNSKNATAPRALL
jgi:hypothetical protein